MSTIQRERCVVCGRGMDFDEPVTISETGVGGVCADCAGLIDLIYQSGVEGMLITKDDADALARKWAAGEVKPEDFDPRIKEWKSEQAVRQAVKEGELHQKQVQDELERRSRAGTFGQDTPAFVDQYPVSGVAEGRERRKRESDALEAIRSEQKIRNDTRREEVRQRVREAYTEEDMVEHLVDEVIYGEYSVPGLEDL